MTNTRGSGECVPLCPPPPSFLAYIPDSGANPTRAHVDFNIVCAGLRSPLVYDLSQNVTAPTGHARPRLISQQRAEKRERESRKWALLPCGPPPAPSHQARDYQPTPQRLFPSMQHLVSKECPPDAPLVHVQGSCILCCSGTARRKAFCCKPSEFSAGRGVIRQIDEQPAAGGSSTHSVQGGNLMTRTCNTYHKLYCELCPSTKQE